MSTIGIPRTLHYYKYYPLWQALFIDLGFKVITSPATNRVCLEQGSHRLVADTCIPLKAYIGHVYSLCNQCDMVFVPVIRSLERKVYNCSRLMGVSDLVKVIYPGLKILEIEIDVNRDEKWLKSQILTFSENLNIELEQFQLAGQKAKRVYLKYLAGLTRQQLTYQEGLDAWIWPENLITRLKKPAEITVGLIGHPYMVNDQFLNHDLIQRIRQYGVRVVTPEMLSRRALNKGVLDLTGASYWTSETDVIGAAGSYLTNAVDGIIGVTAFSCGPDSLMMRLVNNQAASGNKTPFLCLTLDEHSSETGMVTRLEAFLEMIFRKKRMHRV
jgi:predicted nucleotide-binding protein (sugar kinase/HSP70/actin superfamily)